MRNVPTRNTFARMVECRQRENLVDLRPTQIQTNAVDLNVGWPRDFNLQLLLVAIQIDISKLATPDQPFTSINKISMSTLWQRVKNQNTFEHTASVNANVVVLFLALILIVLQSSFDADSCRCLRLKDIAMVLLQ